MTITTLVLITAALGGLCIGSFLNVVIHRLPLMLTQRWRDDCLSLTQPDEPLPVRPTYNLAMPGSACPHCQHVIRWQENIPLISWLALRGRCSGCKTPISLRYPIIEALTGALTVLVVAMLGTQWSTLFALIFTWSLIALTMIDYDTTLLPDDITLPLMWLGLLIAIPAGGIALDDAVIGAAAGYLSLWSVYWSFKLITGKEGMGYGDFKLLAGLGAWLGWQKIALVIMLSSGVGALVGGTLILIAGRDRAHPIPFGPFLAAAGFIALLWGDALLAGPLSMFRFG